MTFPIPRPRGAGVIAPIKPVKRNTPGAALTVKGTTRVLNARGVFQAPLNPNAASIVIEGQAQGQASADKRRRISPSGTK